MTIKKPTRPTTPPIGLNRRYGHSSPSSRPPRVLLPDISCPFCDTTFTPTRAWQVYCTSKCQNNNYNALRKVYRTGEPLGKRNLRNLKEA